jgi:predicted Zn-dependent protease
MPPAVHSIHLEIAMRFTTITAGIAAAFSLGCAVNPVSHKNELSLVSEQDEIAMGKQGADDVVRTIGLYQNPEVQDYVNKLGISLAKQTERPNLPWKFQVVDDPAVNAFALPGGYIFVTRGMMTHITNEAELASVLGHEAGHVAAKHTVQQISQAEVAQLGLSVGMMLSSEVAKYGDVANAGLSLLFLKFSRDDEKQADELGFRYALSDGYDTRQMVKMFQMLQTQDQMGGAGKLPEWQSTHPAPENRISATQARVDAATTDWATKIVGTPQYLALIDGMKYGDDPRQGFFKGMLFMQPDMKFQFQFPDNWMTQNTADAVIATSKSQDAVIELRLAQGTADAALQTFLKSQGVTAGTTSRGTIHGNSALQGNFGAQTSGGAAVQGIATFIQYGSTTFQILAYTTTDKFASYAQAFTGSAASFDRLTDPQALAARPMQIKLERVSRDMTLEQFNVQYPSAIPVDELALINGLQRTSTLVVGQVVKRVVKPSDSYSNN